MCPVPIAVTASNSMPTSECSTNARDEETRILNRYNSYEYDEETSAYQLTQISVDWSLKLNRHLPANCRNISDEVFPGIHLGDSGSPTLWSTYHDLKAVLNAPVIKKRVVNVIYDDSRRIVDMTETFPNLHIGDEGAAKNAFYLKKVGVTHVLNTAEGTRVGLVDTNQNFYRPFGIQYKGLKLLDVAQTNIAMYFGEVAEFIDEALNSGGKVLVNCLMGMSRSSTCVLAYLMLRQNMTAVEALTEVRRYREVRPNDGFLRQLADLDNKLRRERGQLK